ncbi:MAG TPA: UDP-glucose 4-epimerase GalE [Methanosarcina sp.]|nr:UDP-glucose 4-epimerase GalE [Methanosarcina sp.]
MRVFVTGGCGYIGSHVARAFKLNGDEVHIIDRVKRDHTLKDVDGWIIDDYASDAVLATIISMEPDVIVHCAGTSLVGPSMTNPSEYYNNNVAKTITLLDTVKNLPKKPMVLFSSSASVYGEPDEIPIRESHRIKPMSPYGDTKAIIEMLLKDYWFAYRVPSICFRYFNAAGAMPGTFDLGQEPGATHIVAKILEASLGGHSFTINGDMFDTPDGTCIRDYVHVWDIATAHVNGVNYLKSNIYPDPLDNPGYHVFNLGTNTGVSNKQIAEYVKNKYGLVDVRYGGMRSGDPAQLIADATEARTELGWVPAHSSIEEIIDSAYKWYSR